jgi:hypothetical protein
VALKEGVDFLITGDLFSFEHAAAGLIDDAVAQLAVVLDFFAEGLDGHVVEQGLAACLLSLFQHLVCLGDPRPADADELAVFGNQRVVPLLGAEALDLLHATAGRAAVVGKTAHTSGKQCGETPDQAAEDTDRIPEPGAVGGVVDVSFHDGGVGAEFLAVLQSESDRGQHHALIDGFEGDGGEPDEGAVEGSVFGDGPAEELGELPQGIAVGDAFAQLAIVPVLDAHQGQGAQDLRRIESVAAGGGFFQAGLEVLADLLDQRRVLLDEVGDLLEEGIEGDVLGAELEIGEAPWGRGGSGHRVSEEVGLNNPRAL